MLLTLKSRGRAARLSGNVEPLQFHSSCYSHQSRLLVGHQSPHGAKVPDPAAHQSVQDVLKLSAFTSGGYLVSGRLVNGQQVPLILILEQVHLHGVVEVLAQVRALVLRSSSSSCELPADSAR